MRRGSFGKGWRRIPRTGKRPTREFCRKHWRQRVERCRPLRSEGGLLAKPCPAAYLPPRFVHSSAVRKTMPWPLHAFSPLQAPGADLHSLWPLQALTLKHGRFSPAAWEGEAEYVTMPTAKVKAAAASALPERVMCCMFLFSFNCRHYCRQVINARRADHLENKLSPICLDCSSSFREACPNTNRTRSPTAASETSGVRRPASHIDPVMAATPSASAKWLHSPKLFRRATSISSPVSPAISRRTMWTRRNGGGCHAYFGVNGGGSFKLLS